MVERGDFDFDLFGAGDFAFDAAHVGPRVGFGDIENGFTDLLWSADGDLPDGAVFADLAEFFATTRQGFDEDTFPAVLFEEPGLAQARGVVGADFHEDAVWFAIEIVPDDFVFVILGEGLSCLLGCGQVAIP